MSCVRIEGRIRAANNSGLFLDPPGALSTFAAGTAASSDRRGGREGRAHPRPVGAPRIDCPTVTRAGTGSFEFEAASGLYNGVQCGLVTPEDSSAGCAQRDTAAGLAAASLTQSVVYSTTSVGFRATGRDKL
jgi:hypothetical protein